MTEEERRLELLKVVSERLDREDENISRLSLEQLEFITNDINCASFLNSCPGSGKTEVVGFKAAFESSSWDNTNSGIAILTFTRNAASEICKRAGDYSNQKAVQFPHFVGTIDSWLHQYILQPFCYSVMNYEGKNGDTSVSIVDSDFKAPFLNAYKTVISYTPYSEMQINDYYINCEDESLKFEKNYNNRPLTRQNVHDLKQKKIDFAQNGFATYQDAEYWSYNLLTSNRNILGLIAKRFPYLIIDECQDLPPTRLKLLEVLKNEGVIFHFVGDLHQSIYDFIDVDPEKIKEFIANSEMLNMKLTRNFRSNQKIVNLCSKLVGNHNIPGGCTMPDDCNSCLLWEYETDKIHTLPALFESYLKEKNIDCNNCSILVRGNTLLEKVKKTITINESVSSNIATAYFIYRSNSSKLNIDSLDLLGKSMCTLAYNGKGEKQNHYCPETYEHIPWRKFLIDILSSSENIANFTFENTSQTWSQWCASLKEYLEPYFTSLPNTSLEWSNAKRKIMAPSRKGEDLVTNSFNSPISTSTIRMTTIHNIKGETLDAVMLISSSTRHSKGGHFEDWLEDANSEYARFAYVACSRPRHLLIIAVPSLSDEQKSRLQSIGLIQEGMPGTLSYWF